MYFSLKVYFLFLINMSGDSNVKVSAQEVFNNSKNTFMYKSVGTGINNSKDLFLKYDDSDESNTTLYGPEPLLMPYSFAILVNFGIDGKQRFLFSSDTDSHECPDKQIWDPFNRNCRQLYCSTNAILVDFKCVQTSSTDNNFTKPYASFLDSRSQFVNITLSFRLMRAQTRILEWINQQKTSFEDQFTQQFANSFAQLAVERIANVTVVSVRSPYTLVVNFFLLEANNSTKNTNNDAILAVLSTTISQRALSFDLYNNTVKAYSIHTSIPVLKTFCNRDSDMPIWYWNSEFTIYTETNITYLYVNETGRRYRPGQYLGNILYVQNLNITNQLMPNNVKVSSYAVVCETETLINESCARVLLNRSEYEWIDTNDSTKLLTNSGEIHDKYELAPNGTYVCLEDHIDSGCTQDIVEAILSTVLMVISIAAMTCVLITYLTFKCLRATISGFNLINLALCLELMQILFLTSPYIFDCIVAAMVLHYVVLLTMSWSSIIAYDMYRTFGVTKIKIRHKNILKLRLNYCFLANICAVLVISLAIICEKLDLKIKPDYGQLGDHVCWFQNPWATFLYFGVPLAINILINLILYLMTICQMRTDLKTSDTLRKITRIPSDSSQTSNCSTATERSVSVSTTSTTSLSHSSGAYVGPNQVLIFTRLGVLMGFTWVIAIFIAITPQRYDTLSKVLSYIFVICNTSQGVVLFIAFLCNTKVRKLWTNLIDRKLK